MKSGKKKYDYKNFNDLADDKIFDIDLSWMYNPQLYDEISQNVFTRYNKDKHSNELGSIQNFLDNITNEYIKNKKDALEEFKTVKNNVKSENLKDIVKELERAIFGYDYDDNEEPKYKESIAERTKMRRQNKETDKKDASRTFAPPDPDSDDSDKLIEIYDTPYSSIIDDIKTEEGGYDREGYDGAGYNKWGFNEYGFNKDWFNEYGFNEYGFNKDGFIKNGFNEHGFNKDGYDAWGFNEDGKKNKKFNKWGCNINGFDRQGLNRNRYNINGYSNSGYDSENYNINGYNSSGYDRDRSNINGLFSIWAFFHDHSQFTGLQGKGEGISLTPHYHFHPLHRHVDISRAIAAESSPLHIASSLARTGNLWFPSASR